MARCEYCLKKTDKHDKRCPRKLPAGWSRRCAIAEWKDGFRCGFYGIHPMMPTKRVFWWFGYGMGIAKADAAETIVSL